MDGNFSTSFFKLFFLKKEKEWIKNLLTLSANVIINFLERVLKLTLREKCFFGSQSELFPENGSVSGLSSDLSLAQIRRKRHFQERVQLAYINHFALGELRYDVGLSKTKKL